MMAVSAGEKVMTSMDNLAPITVRDLNNIKSPRKKPINPETDNQIHCCGPAPVGKNDPCTTKPYTPSMKKAIIKRMMLTSSDPTFRLAASNEEELAAQQMETDRATASPKKGTCIGFLRKAKSTDFFRFYVSLFDVYPHSFL